MDNLTHGLLGLAVAALRRPDDRRRASPTDKAVILACVLAAELPDLDYLWPAANAVMEEVQAHRGPSHSVFLAPLLALVATGVARLLFRGARSGPVYGYSLMAVVFAHLIPDLWTGWGVRALLPLSGERFAWDLTMVLDPFFTLPLLAGAVWAIFRRAHWRRAILSGLLVSLLYLGARGAAYGMLHNQITQTYPLAERVQVFPAFLGFNTWRYVAILPTEYAVGKVALTGIPVEQRRHLRPQPGFLPSEVQAVPTVREALAWARFPLISETPLDGGRLIRIADLRYHLHGNPTLAFEVNLGPDLAVRSVRLDRGGTARDLLSRWRRQ